MALLTSYGCDDGFEEPGPTDDCIEPDVDELPFEKSSIEKLLRGSHESTLAWLGPGTHELAEDERTRDLVLEVRKTGDLKWGLHCGGYVRIPVEAELILAGERSATFRGQVYGRKEGAQFLTSTKSRVADKLGIPGPAVVGEGSSSYLLSGWIDNTGTRGALYSESDTAGECERARWPVDRVCRDTSDREMPFDTRFGDFDFDQAVDQLEGLEPQTLVWDDGTETTVMLTFERGEEPVCVGIDHIGLGQTLRTTITARVKTEDGRVDATLPVELTVQWSAKRGVITVPGGHFDIDHSLTVSGNTARTGARLFRPFESESEDPATFQSLDVYLTVGRKVARGSMYLGLVHVDASNPQIARTDALERGSLDGVCTEGASSREELAKGSFGPSD